MTICDAGQKNNNLIGELWCVASVTVTVTLNNEEEFGNCYFLTGFHGVGLTGYITMNHIVKSLRARPIGYVETPQQPALVSLVGDRISFPFELFKHDDLVILFPRIQPKRLEVREFTQEIVSWVTKNEFKEAVLIGGLDNRFRHTDESIRCVPTSPSLEKARRLKIPLLEEALFVTGPIALMLTYFEMKKFPAIALLPYSERGRPDPRAAALAVKQINDLFGLSVDTFELINDAKRIEDEVIKIMDGQKEKTGHDSQTMYT